MKNVLIALMLVLVTASLKAITIQWSVPNYAPGGVYNDGWQAKFQQDAGADLGVYFVYSETKYDSASEVWTNKNAKGNQVVSVKADANDEKTYINGEANSAAKLSIDVSSNAASTTRFALQLDAALTATGDSFAPGGYFYLVVFDPTAAATDAPLYAVSKAAKYTAATEATAEATAAATAANNALGIYTTTAGEDPLVGDFIEIGWMGGNWTAVPEPTALALLALGVAGLALRRKL